MSKQVKTKKISLSSTFANLLQYSVVEELLKFFIAVVDAKLLKAVHLKIF